MDYKRVDICTVRSGISCKMQFKTNRECNANQLPFPGLHYTFLYV